MGSTDAATAAAAARRELDRERQDAVLGPLDFTRARFEHARFIAAVTGFAQAKGGDIKIELMVPFEYRDQATAMLDASGIPVSVDVVPWRRNASHQTRAEERVNDVNGDGTYAAE